MCAYSLVKAYFSSVQLYPHRESSIPPVVSLLISYRVVGSINATDNAPPSLATKTDSSGTRAIGWSKRRRMRLVSTALIYVTHMTNR